MHGIDLTTQMDIFYLSMNYTSKGIIDAACCGAFKRKSAEEARQLIEDLTKCNYKGPSETSELDALMNKIGNQDRRMYSVHEVEIVERNE